MKCSKENCKGKVIGSHSVDIDVPKMYFCENHKEDVKMAFLFAMFGQVDLTLKILENDTSGRKIRDKKDTKRVHPDRKGTDTGGTGKRPKAKELNRDGKGCRNVCHKNKE
jgi:hypothetical protein